MKKTILLFMLFLFIGIKIAVAQETYIPLIVPGNQWNELAENGSLPPEYQYKRTYITTIGSDTLINNLTYFKLLTAKDALSSEWGITGYIREDFVNQKVYFKPIGKPELLLYDFQVQVGDHILSYDYQLQIEPAEILNTVEVIEFVSIQGKLHKKVTVRSTLVGDNPDEFTNHTWIEGIGGTDGLLKSHIPFLLPGNDKLSLLCFFQNEELVYKPVETGIEDCFVWRYTQGTRIENQPVVISDYTVQQNENILTIFSEKQVKLDVEILNPAGRVLLRNSSEGNVLQMDISRINRGIYIVRIFADNKIYNQKILKR
jgi:hypothetical protein